MRNLIISNIISDQLSRRTSSITAIPGSYIENVKLSHLMFDIYSEGTKEEAAAAVAEKDNSYPSPHSFGTSLPAYGFYIRHVKNITFNDVQFNMMHTDLRYPLVFEDTHYGTLNDVQIKASKGETRDILPVDLKVSGSTSLSIDHKSIN